MPSDIPRRQTNFLKYHRLPLDHFESALPTLKEESRQCIQNLLRYRSHHPTAKFPRTRSAAVLVPLFVGRAGDLYVLLSRRSAELRSYAGDTSLPGGKVEAQDKTLEDTARREAFEEVGIVQDKEKVPLLCVMEPFLAGNQTIVTPVVVLILDKTLQPILNVSEVASIFSHPLVSFLSSDPPFPSEPETVEVSYHTARDHTWSKHGIVRVHSFLTGREAGGIKPVFGLTANILIHTAMVGYARTPDFEVQPPSAPSMAKQIAHAILSGGALRAAYDAEGLDAERAVKDLLRRRWVLGGFSKVGRERSSSKGLGRRGSKGGGSKVQKGDGGGSGSWGDPKLVEEWKGLGKEWMELLGERQKQDAASNKVNNATGPSTSKAQNGSIEEKIDMRIEWIMEQVNIYKAWIVEQERRGGDVSKPVEKLRKQIEKSNALIRKIRISADGSESGQDGGGSFPMIGGKSMDDLGRCLEATKNGVDEDLERGKEGSKAGNSERQKGLGRGLEDIRSGFEAMNSAGDLGGHGRSKHARRKDTEQLSWKKRDAKL
ncbi:hypothetical protein SERLA73DRAFT_187238 [Serpula lacrymans var. lacrymans S7.3]|uniref:Nudix hydrolase domain-containing protein n=2 Tax=Serpula lacrymans var. lacrymans TaxID=341189 RepID=F8Q8Q9_SERL3|nr:uncharacterized protein SERLADRAFT_476673 [Serpula lacrymans var. lacrymans S7.9]EGN94964.1 hypothetical protein SERLA73DRAFT_187238 [Serpula lacrymans var. lacrymans S7.3]EGO20454.1 hypothetical protein SERLADRAFT_476673 [Serpula lacrymans var. lacrymans S7.9]